MGEIKRIIGSGKKSFQDLENILRSTIILKPGKEFQSHTVRLVLLYDCETWNINNNMEGGGGDKIFRTTVLQANAGSP